MWLDDTEHTAKHTWSTFERNKSDHDKVTTGRIPETQRRMKMDAEWDNLIGDCYNSNDLHCSGEEVEIPTTCYAVTLQHQEQLKRQEKLNLDFSANVGRWGVWRIMERLELRNVVLGEKLTSVARRWYDTRKGWTSTSFVSVGLARSVSVVSVSKWRQRSRIVVGIECLPWGLAKGDAECAVGRIKRIATSVWRGRDIR